MHNKSFNVWRQIAVGKRVEITAGLYKGRVGTIEEKLDTRIDGLSRYGLRMSFGSHNNIADFCRCEFKPAKPKMPSLFL